MYYTKLRPSVSQIKYCIRSATALAEQSKELLMASHFETVLDLAEEFKLEFADDSPSELVNKDEQLPVAFEWARHSPGKLVGEGEQLSVEPGLAGLSPDGLLDEHLYTFD